MSLPIAGGGGSPARPPTHNEIDLNRLAKLGLELDDIAEDDVLEPEAIDELAQTLGVDASHLYAAAALVTDYDIARSAEVQFVVCGGNCQKWGALDLLEELVGLRQERLDDGRAAFDVAARRCLDRCQQAPAVMIRTPDGTAYLAEASAEAVATAVAEACGD